MKWVITGGGTGGHVLAGVALAQEWIAAGNPRSSILFFGARGGIEERLVPKADLALELIEIGALNQVGWTRRIKTLVQLPSAMWKAIRVLRAFRPDAVIGVGGYASGPIVLSARLFTRATTAFLEQNSVPGLTNRILSHFVHRIFVAFPGTELHFSPRLRSRIEVTGNPVRKQLQKLPSAPPQPFRVFVFGGSQGAVGINRAVLRAAAELRERKVSIQWVHQTGVRDKTQVQSEYQKLGIQAEVHDFIDDMVSQYQAANLVICRAGSSTLSELAAVGRAAILVPFPQASNQHQLHNARAFSSRNAAFVVEQGEGAASQIVEIIQNAIAHPQEIAAMQERVTQLARLDSAAEIVNQLKSIGAHHSRAPGGSPP